MAEKKLPIVYVALHRFRIGYEVGTSGYEAYEAIVDAPDRETAEEKVRKFVDTYEIPPGMQGEPEMVNASNETLGIDTMEIVHVEKLEPAPNLRDLRRMSRGHSGAPSGSQGPFSKRQVDAEDSRLLLRTLTKRLEGPGKGWHGEPGRHRAAAKKGKK